MKCDVAVLGGGPGRVHGGDPGRAARRERRLHRAGAGARRHLPARRLHPDEGVGADRALPAPGARLVREARRRRSTSRSSTSRPRTSGSARVVSQMTGGVASLFKANGVEWVQGKGAFRDANTIAVEGGEDVDVRPRRSSRRARSRSGRRSRASTRSSASTRPACSRRPRCRARLVILGGGIIGCEFASILRTFGSEVTIDRDARPPDPAGGRGRREGAREGLPQEGDRARARQAVHGRRGVGRRADRALRRGRVASRPT